MNYDAIVEGRFLERPNRFIAYVEIDGRKERVHVKNTGRCRELLLPGARVYLEKGKNAGRSTPYDLVAVRKGDRIVNMDSQAPNIAVGEWLRAGGLFPEVTLIKPETTYGNSRFDFYVETKRERVFLEVKGVTLEKHNVVSFPDAPSERAVKHIEELVRAKQEGYRAIVLFVVQMEGAEYFVPNRDTHPEFAEALCRAAACGVEVLARECLVTPDTMRITGEVPVYLRGDAGLLKEIPGPLLDWYDKNRRMLPWREVVSPYRVWISEIMLQQTRVEAVKSYFQRFIASLPDIKALAEVEEERLLKLWEGLGYYNRARNLKKAAITVMEEYGGAMPADYDQLLSLAGIGSYTAGAISSIAFGIKRPAVDGNVLRVLARLRTDRGKITDAKVKREVEKDLLEIMPADRPGDFNQAMMEIGACVCIPNGAPLCEKCPLGHLCRAHCEGVEDQFPVRDEKRARSIEKKTVLIVRNADRAVIRKRPGKGLLAGLYELPWLEGHVSRREVMEFLKKNGIEPLQIKKLNSARHIFTHKEWDMIAYWVRVDELEPKRPGEATSDWIYIHPEETKERFPIPSAFAAYMNYLSIKIGKEGIETINESSEDIPSDRR